MADCASLPRCSFFKLKAENKSQQLALNGFMAIYCRGPKQEQCVRRFVGRTLGGPDKIPLNMLPNGLPMSGTSASDWTPEVRALLTRKRSPVSCGSEVCGQH